MHDGDSGVSYDGCSAALRVSADKSYLQTQFVGLLLILGANERANACVSAKIDNLARVEGTDPHLGLVVIRGRMYLSVPTIPRTFAGGVSDAALLSVRVPTACFVLQVYTLRSSLHSHRAEDNS